MEAQLIRATVREPFYMSEYVYKCIKCGDEYTRCTYNNRISPYCGKCQREIDREKSKAYRQNKRASEIIAELEKIKTEIDVLYGVYNSHFKERLVIKTDVIQILDKHIEELKGGI